MLNNQNLKYKIYDFFQKCSVEEVKEKKNNLIQILDIQQSMFNRYMYSKKNDSVQIPLDKAIKICDYFGIDIKTLINS